MRSSCIWAVGVKSQVATFVIMLKYAEVIHVNTGCGGFISRDSPGYFSSSLICSLKNEPPILYPRLNTKPQLLRLKQLTSLVQRKIPSSKILIHLNRNQQAQTQRRLCPWLFAQEFATLGLLDYNNIQQGHR